jgi:hypothetical protein
MLGFTPVPQAYSRTGIHLSNDCDYLCDPANRKSPAPPTDPGGRHRRPAPVPPLAGFTPIAIATSDRGARRL